MRTTLDIEDDVLQAAKELAQREGSTAGRVISQLARRGLTEPTEPTSEAIVIRNGVPIFPSRGEVVTMEHIQEIMDQREFEMRALLDVNVIIALLDADHVFHGRAHTWWAANAKEGWASCPLTENGVIRIMSNAGYSQLMRFKPGDLIARLRRFISGNDHEFWPDDISFCDGKSFTAEHLHSSRLLTDFYLLGLAVKNNGRLVTFDQRIPLSTVSNAKAENLYVA